jgi:hypothetical protein
VDYVIIELPAGAANFIGEMAHELIALVDKGTIRVIDLIILVKNEDGSIDADLDESGIDPRRSALIAYAGAVPRRRGHPAKRSCRVRLGLGLRRLLRRSSATTLLPAAHRWSDDRDETRSHGPGIMRPRPPPTREHLSRL